MRIGSGIGTRNILLVLWVVFLFLVWSLHARNITELIRASFRVSLFSLKFASKFVVNVWPLIALSSWECSIGNLLPKWLCPEVGNTVKLMVANGWTSLVWF